MTQKINFLIKQDKIQKRIFKFFVNKKGDIFISFPYFNSTQYYCGIGCIPAGTRQHNFNPVFEGTRSRIPVKLSYHHDGQIHFKPISPLINNLRLSFKNAQIKCTPFLNLRAQHIITIEVEGLSRFKDFIPTKPSEIYRGFDVPPNAKRFKFVFYAGLSQNDVEDRFKYCKSIKIERTSLLNPLILGLCFTHSPESLDKQNPKPSLLCMAGFSANEIAQKHDLHFLYVNAK